MNRGILVTAYASLAKDVTEEEIRAAYEKYYKNEYFVRLLEPGVPQTRWVEGSNFADVNFKLDPRTKRVVMMGAIDNMVKGAAGQAVPEYEPDVWPSGKHRLKAGAVIPVIQGLKAV